MAANKIIIIDDEEDIGTLLKRLLIKNGYDCIISYNGTEGLNKIKEFKPDLILLDYNLNDMTAKQLINNLGEYCCEFIIMTGFGNEKLAVEMMKLGARDYIVKDLEFLDILPPIVDRAINEINVKKKLAESQKALKESEEKLRSIFENSSVGMYRTSFDGTMLAANFAAKKILGLENVDDITKINLEEEEIKKFFKRTEFLEKIEKTNEIIGHEFIWHKSDGGIVIIRENSRAFLNDKNEIDYFEGTLEDITSRVETELALKNSEERLKRVMEAANDGIWDWNLNNDTAYCSPRFYSMLEIEKGEIEAGFSKFLQYVYEGDRKKLFNKFRAHLKNTEEVLEIEIRIKTKKNNIIWVLIKAKIVEKDKFNKPVRFVGILSDITERILYQKNLENYKIELEKLVDRRTKRLIELNQELKNIIETQRIAEIELKDRAKFFKTLIDTAPNPIFIKDIDKKYIDCNNAFEKYFNLQKEKIIGQRDIDFLNSNIANKYENIDDELLENPGHLEYEGLYADNMKKREFIVSKATFLKSDGTPGGLIAIVTDITERKKLEHNILRALEKERELKDLKTRFVSIASHEFRTPLTTILSSADLIDIFNERGNKEKYLGHINKIKSAANQMTELIDDILTVNKAESLKLEYKPASLNFYDLCISILDEIKILTKANQKIEFLYETKNKIYYLDKKLIAQVLKNLLNNAIKYSGENGLIIFKIEEINDKLCIEVKDNGIGIPPEDIENMFEPFYRCKNAGNIPGTGLGLSIVKKSLEIQNGNIILKSKLNEGTSFIITLEKIMENEIENNFNY